ncbi:MAG: hypothetical protein V3V98_04895 [Thermoplasmata archaeon]
MISSLDDYVQCARDAGGQLERRLGENFESFFVIGSLAQDDVVPGWSDIDSVLVVNRTDETLEGMIETLRREMARKYEFLRSERGSKLGIFLISLDDLLSCKISEGRFPSSLNFHDFRFNSKRMAGEDLSRRFKVPEVTEEEVGLILSGYHDLLEREANSSAYWKGRNAIISILNAARLSLMMEGVIVTKKRDILEASTKALPKGKEIIERAVLLRENWMKEKDDDESLEQVYEDALRFLGRHIRRAEARRSVLQF